MQLGHVGAHRLVEVELFFFMEHRCGHRSKQLGIAGNAKHRLGGDGKFAGHIAIAVAFGEDHFVFVHNAHRAARDLPLSHQLLYVLIYFE